MEKVVKKQGVPKSKSPSTAIHKDSRTITGVRTIRTRSQTRAEQFQYLNTSRKDPNSTPPLPPSVFVKQEAVTEEENTHYYVDGDAYDNLPGFFRDIREAINDALFNGVVIDPAIDPNNKVQEKQPKTRLRKTHSSESVTADKVLNSVNPEDHVRRISGANYFPTPKVPNSSGSAAHSTYSVGNFGYLQDLKRTMDDAYIRNIMTGPGKKPDKGISHHWKTIFDVKEYIQSLYSKDPDWNRISGYFSMTGPGVGERSTEGSSLSVENRMGLEQSESYEAGYVLHNNSSAFQGTQSSFVTDVGTTDIDDRRMLSKFWGHDIQTIEVEEYQEKSLMSNYSSYIQVLARRETIGPHKEESMHYGPVPAFVSGMDTISEGTREDVAEALKQALPIGLPGKIFDRFHKIMMLNNNRRN